MLLLRGHVLALGHSGVRPLIVERMVEMLNLDLIPSVPEQGSLGASGDLAPLANLALPLIGQGELLTPGGGTEPAGPVLAAAGLAPIALEAKEGLALVNGTQGMLAIGILAAERVANLARAADVVTAMWVVAALGTDAPFDERLQRLRPHPGQGASAANLRTRRSRKSPESIGCVSGRRGASQRGAAENGHPVDQRPPLMFPIVPLMFPIVSATTPFRWPTTSPRTAIPKRSATFRPHLGLWVP